jgi:uncharacterized lipoprotein YddW (UPF0748 family)
MQRVIGVPMKINNAPAELQRDLLQECIIEAHRNGMLCIAWFEYGFMAAHKDTHNELRARRDWLSLDQHGNEVAKNGFVWLNPLHPEAQQLLIDIVVEAVKNYDLDGIQLDDRIVWPGLEMGYDEYTRKAYAAEHGGREPPADVRDPAWMKWRQDKVEAFSKRFVREVREAAGKDMIISLSPGPHPWALENYLIDWPGWLNWQDNPKWDEYVPQIYRMNYERFGKDMKEQVDFVGGGKDKLIAGIRLVGDGPDLPPGDVAKSGQACRDANIAGHCWWFSRGVLDVFRGEIAAFYNVEREGQAPHPEKGADWRPPPVVAERVGEAWVVEVPVAARYREIRQVDGQWKQVGASSFPGGRSTLIHRGDEAVLLLRDRRPDN